MKLTQMGAIAAPLLLVGTTAVAASFAPKADAHGLMFFASMRDDVTIETENIDGGVQTTVTTNDAEVLEKLLSHPENKREHEGIDLEISDLENGIVITRTSTDEEIAARIQEKAAHKQFKQSITRTVTNLENGVQIEATSDNLEAVEWLQTHDMPEQKKERENVTVERVDLENGVRTTLTSTDEETITRIQSMAERGPKHGPGGRKHFSMGKNGHGEGGRFIPHNADSEE